MKRGSLQREAFSCLQLGVHINSTLKYGPNYSSLTKIQRAGHYCFLPLFIFISYHSFSMFYSTTR